MNAIARAHERLYRSPQIEKIDLGEIRTGFMRFGDRVRMQARFDDGRDGPFGAIDQRVVSSR